jgi:RNA polymerase sigma factor (sigma-70 family)
MRDSALPLEIVLVEDDPAVRAGLQLLIGTSPSCRCAGAFASGEEALKKLSGITADVVLMDINLPGMSGIECIQRLRMEQPNLQIMMLTVFEDHDRIFQSLSAGASGYLLKQTPPTKLLESILELHQGGAPMSTQIARRVVEAFRESSSRENASSALSPREREIIALLAKGYLYKEIATALGLSVETIRTHLHNIYEKLHVRSRTEAVMKVFGRKSPV